MRVLQTFHYPKNSGARYRRYLVPGVSIFLLSYNSPNCQNRLIIRISVLNSCSRCAGMHDSSAAQIQRHMACIADDVACLSSFIGNLASCTSHSSRVSRQAVSVLPVHCPDKSGAVRTVCQARSARYIRVSDELAGIRRNVASTRSARRGNGL